jgi:putative flippase GtrA
LTTLPNPAAEIAQNQPPPSPLATLTRALHNVEAIRYLLVGGFNTFFSIALARILVFPVQFFFPKLTLALALPIANYVAFPFSTTVSFLGFKWFVFRTHGDYAKEWLKCFAVYSIALPIPGVVLPLFTALFVRYPLTTKHAALLALIINSAVIAGCSYVAHKKFSFKR